jgi:hypothetical protein
MPIPVFVEPVDTRDERRESAERPVFCGLGHSRATPGIKHSGESSDLRSEWSTFCGRNSELRAKVFNELRERAIRHQVTDRER